MLKLLYNVIIRYNWFTSNANKKLHWSGAFGFTHETCPCIFKAFVKQGNQLNDLVKISLQIYNFTDHEKAKSKNYRITVPSRVQMAQEIVAEGLGNTLSKNIIDNSEKTLGFYYIYSLNTIKTILIIHCRYSKNNQL